MVTLYYTFLLNHMIKEKTDLLNVIDEKTIVKDFQPGCTR